LRRLLFLFLFFIVPLGVGLAQNAEISGIVTDSTKAVIPNASVVITHQATGTKITTVTNGVGYYFAPSLVSGNIRLPSLRLGLKRSLGTTSPFW